MICRNLDEVIDSHVPAAANGQLGGLPTPAQSSLVGEKPEMVVERHLDSTPVKVFGERHLRVAAVTMYRGVSLSLFEAQTHVAHLQRVCMRRKDGSRHDSGLRIR